MPPIRDIPAGNVEDVAITHADMVGEHFARMGPLVAFAADRTLGAVIFEDEPGVWVVLLLRSDEDGTLDSQALRLHARLQLALLLLFIDEYIAAP